MPYKDKVLQKEAVRKAVAKRRVLQSGITSEGITEEGITEYHPILNALIDPVKRQKLQAICDSLGKRNLLSKVYYGTRQPVDFDMVNELLEATQ